MRVSRTFNLTSLGLKYESVTIEVEKPSMSEAIIEIENSFKTYSEAIKKGLVQ